MKYSQTLKCNADEVWNALETSLLYEVERVIEKKVKPEDIQKGFHYQKKMNAGRGGSMTAKVLIKDFTKPSRYAAEFLTSEGTNYLSYSIEPLNEYQCTVTYEETYEGKKKLNSWNAKLMSKILSIRNKRKIKRTLKSIEDYAVSQRNSNNKKAE